MFLVKTRSVPVPSKKIFILTNGKMNVYLLIKYKKGMFILNKFFKKKNKRRD